MMENNLFNSNTFTAFWAKVLLFLFSFSFSTSIFANQIFVEKNKVENITLESVSDSLVQHFTIDETTKIYLSEGTTFYNNHQIEGNVEILQEDRSTKVEIKKESLHLAKSSPKKHSIAKPKEEEKYKAQVQFRPLPFEPNTIFAQIGGKIISVPATNSQLKMVVLVAFHQILFFIPTQEKHISIYTTSLVNDINQWQLHIRPPPAI